MKTKRYFVVVNEVVDDEDDDLGLLELSINAAHQHPSWKKKDAIEWAKDLAKRGNTAKVYEAEAKAIKGFTSKIRVIDDDKDLKKAKKRKRK